MKFVSNCIFAGFEVLAAMKIQIEVVWFVCSDVTIYHCFGGPFHFHLQVATWSSETSVSHRNTTHNPEDLDM
jgi:hypothetical protein